MQPNIVIVTNNNVGKGRENSLSLFKWMQMDEDREKFQLGGFMLDPGPQKWEIAHSVLSKYRIL